MSDRLSVYLRQSEIIGTVGYFLNYVMAAHQGDVDCKLMGLDTIATACPIFYVSISNSMVESVYRRCAGISGRVSSVVTWKRHFE